MSLDPANFRLSDWARRKFLVGREAPAKGATILTYHSVSARPSPLASIRSIQHSPAEFERQLDYLSERFQFVSLRELIENLRAGRSVEKSLVLTFDDGYADILRTALPMLHRRRIPATVFLVTSVVGNADLLWTHKLSWLIARGEQHRVWTAFAAEGYPEAEADESLASFARRCFRADTPAVLESVLRSVGVGGAQLARQMRPYFEAEDVTDSNADLVDFGNHTHSHPVLSALTHAAQRQEISAAFDVLNSLRGRPPLALAYPFGHRRHYSGATVALASQCGHQAALDMRRRDNSRETSPFELSRKPAAIGSQRVFERILRGEPVAPELKVGHWTHA